VSKSNLEAGEFLRGEPHVFGLMEDVSTQFLVQFDEKIVHFLVRAFENELHPAVGQIPNESGDLEPGGERARRISEPDSLHPAGKKDFALFINRAWHVFSFPKNKRAAEFIPALRSPLSLATLERKLLTLEIDLESAAFGHFLF
jgi:hypothetical protein